MQIEMIGGGREKMKMSYLRGVQSPHVLHSIALKPRDCQLRNPQNPGTIRKPRGGGRVLS